MVWPLAEYGEPLVRRHRHSVGAHRCRRFRGHRTVDPIRHQSDRVFAETGRFCLARLPPVEPGVYIRRHPDPVILAETRLEGQKQKKNQDDAENTK